MSVKIIPKDFLKNPKKFFEKNLRKISKFLKHALAIKAEYMPNSCQVNLVLLAFNKEPFTSP